MTKVTCACRLRGNQRVKDIWRAARTNGNDTKTHFLYTGIQIQQKTSLCELSGPSLLAPSINTHTLISHCSTLLHTHRANASCVLTASVAKPLVGCWIQASGVQASMSALWTQPCIWQLHGTTYKRMHLSRCSCPNQIIPGVRLIDAVCTPSHSFLLEVLAWHGLLQCVYECVCTPSS